MPKELGELGRSIDALLARRRFDPDLRPLTALGGRWAACTQYMPQHECLLRWISYVSPLVYPPFVVAKASSLSLSIEPGQPTSSGSIGEIAFNDELYSREDPYLSSMIRVELGIFEYLWERSTQGVTNCIVEVALGVRGFVLADDEWESDQWDFKQPLDVRSIKFVFHEQTQRTPSKGAQKQ